VEPIVSEVVRYQVPFGYIEVQSPGISGVSQGTFSENVAIVPPGAAIDLRGIWSTSDIDGCDAPCPKVAYLAYTLAGLPAVTGLLEQYDPHRIYSQAFDFGGVSTTAPTTPGTYYIGLRNIDGDTPDSGPGSFGGNPGAPAASYKIVVVGPPVVTPTISGTVGNNGWYTSDVKVTWSVSDANAPIDSKTGCDDKSIASDGTTTIECIAKSANGTTTKSVTIGRDATAPTLTGTVSPNPVAFSGSATATPMASDALSGLASSATCGSVNTSLAGNFSVTCTATDKAGNTATINVPYTVAALSFSGFQPPINPPPSAWNSVKAGNTVPLTFNLGANKGMSILAAGSPVVRLVSCPGKPASPSVEVKAAGPGLEYEGNGVYTFVWKTDKAWSGRCATFVLALVDGVEHTANFQFK
jgi:hypothetical protein